MRLIDADELKKMWCANCDNRHLCGGKVGCDEVKELYDMPTIEAEPTKHGRWEWNKRLGEWYCSNCDRVMTPYIVEKSEGEYEMAQPFYCGWCGAKMDEVDE